MKSIVKCWPVIAVLCVSIATSAKAQYAEDALRFSILNSPIGGKTAAMGGVSVGIADDYSALFSNPAGLAQLRSYEFSAGLTRYGFTNSVDYLQSSLKADNNSINLNNIGLVYPVPTSRGSLTFAFGYGRVASYNGKMSFDGYNTSSSITQSLYSTENLGLLSAQDRKSILDNDVAYQLYLADYDSVSGFLKPLVKGSVQQTADVVESGGMNHWSLGGAMDVAKDLSLGVSLNFVSGTYTYDRQFVETDPNNANSKYVAFVSTDLNRFTWESTIRSDLSGYNTLIGLMYRKQGKYRVGLAVRTPTTIEVDETFSDDYQTKFDDGYTPLPMSFSNSTKYKVITPWVLSGGLSFQISDFFVIGGDAEYTDWTTLQFDTDVPALKDENLRIQKELRATTNLRGGAEVTLWDVGVKLRGGISYYPSQFKSDPKEFDQLLYTAGIGFMLEENTSLDVAYTIGTWKTYRANYSYPLDITNPANSAWATSTTSEKVNTGNFNATLRFRF